MARNGGVEVKKESECRGGYRSLDAERLVVAARKIADKVEQVFPGSGLSGLAREVACVMQETVGSDARLVMYLDYSSDLLSIVGKLAAYYGQHLQDRVVLDAVNEIENLTTGLSGKIWQKLSMAQGKG